jgi:hypothetical protein
LTDLEQEWRTFLATQPVDLLSQARAKERFRKPAIFRKVCSRELAERAAEARARIGSMPEEAVKLFESMCRDDPHEPDHRLDLADALATAGHASRALELARPMLDDESLTLPVRARAASLITWVEFHSKNWAGAEAAAKRNFELATDDAEMRTAWARQRALADESSRRTLGRVLFGDGSGRPMDPALTMYLLDEFAREHPGEALGAYLKGRQLVWRDARLALSPLGEACPMAGAPSDGPSPEVPLEPLFAKECRWLYSESALLANEIPLAGRIMEDRHAHATLEADRLRASDFLERIEWTRRGGLQASEVKDASAGPGGRQ